MAALGSYLSSLTRYVIGTSAAVSSVDAEKEQILSTLSSALDDLRDKMHFYREFEGLSLAYRTDPDFMINVILLARRKNQYVYHKIINNKLPEELRTMDFAVRILEDVFFTKHSIKEDDFEVMVNIEEEQRVDGIKEDALKGVRESLSKAESPFASNDFADILWKVNEIFLQSIRRH
jgi:hypothetical protein